MRTTEVCISDIGKIITGNTPPRKNPELYGSHTIFIKPTDISDDVKYTRFPEECYSQKGYDKYLNSLIPKGATCVVTIGSIGKKMTKAHQDCFINQAMNAIVPFEHFDEEYVYYLLKHNLGMVKSLDSGTASGRENVSKSSFSKMRVKAILDKNIQNSIGKIFSAYDDLIENNQKQIKLLEEAAMLLYKKWFVKLRFPGHENAETVDGLPEGWYPGILEDIIEFDPKVKLDKEKLKKSVPMAALDTSSMILDEGQFTETYLNAGSKFQNGDTLLARITPCLENGKTAFVSGLPDVDGAVGSTEYIVMRSKRLNPYMVYCIARSNSFRQIAINSMTGADGRQRVQADKLKNITCLIPPAYLVELCGNILQPVFQKISSLNQQCLQLKTARDKLLPKLMNGEIEVL